MGAGSEGGWCLVEFRKDDRFPGAGWGKGTNGSVGCGRVGCRSGVPGFRDGGSALTSVLLVGRGVPSTSQGASCSMSSGGSQPLWNLGM